MGSGNSSVGRLSAVPRDQAPVKNWGAEASPEVGERADRPSSAYCSAQRSNQMTLVSFAFIFSRRASAAKTDIANEFSNRDLLEGCLIDLRRQRELHSL
jgi:hypothetical protein